MNLAISFSLFLALAFTSRAATLCVGPVSSGNASGVDWNNKLAWSSTLVRGNTYYLEDGNYSSKSLTVPTSGSSYIVIKKATVGDHGTSTGWIDSMGDGQAVFAYNILITSGFWIFDGVVGSGWDPNSYGFTISQPANCAANQYFIEIGSGTQTISNLVIAHISARACANDVEKMFVSLSGQAQHFNYSFTNLLSDGFQGTWFMFGLQNGWIENCFLTNHFSSSAHHGDALNLRQGSFGGNKNITVKNSVFGDYTGTGAIVANDANEGDIGCIGLQVYGCTFGTFTGGSGGNGVICTTTKAIFADVSVYNNTFYSGGNPWLSAAMAASSSLVKNSCTNIVAMNNIIYNMNAALGDNATQPIQHDYNTYISTTATPSETHGVITTVNPFVNSAGKNFRLAVAQAGISLASQFGPDPDSKARAIDGVWDRGAFEYGSGFTNPVVSATPATLNFGYVVTNTIRDMSFTVQNIGIGTLAGVASISPPFSIVSGGTYSLGGNQSQSVVVRYAPTLLGSNSQTISFTGGGGATATVSAVASTNMPPTVSAITQNATDVNLGTAGIQIYEGTAVQYSGSASDANGDALSWQWIYTVNGGVETIYQSGTGAVVPISFIYGAGTASNTYVWKLRVSDGVAAAESQLAIGVIAPPAVGSGLSFEAESGVLTAPFVIANGYISQPSTTDITTGGRATYTFTITNAGYHVIQAVISAPSLTENSFYMNIDAEPQDPTMAWDILPPTTGFETRLVSWRGSGTADGNEFVPKYFNLTTGTHQLIIRGREGNVLLDRFAIVKMPAPPQNLRSQP